MTAAMILYMSLAGAPVPKAKPMPPPPAIPAPVACIMTWRGVDAVTHFHAEGVYTCCWQGRWWDGTWSQRDGVLKVEEWPRDSMAGTIRWSVKLATDRTGDMEGTKWAIRPLAGRVD